jgi:hypothetical protein
VKNISSRSLNLEMIFVVKIALPIIRHFANTNPEQEKKCLMFAASSIGFYLYFIGLKEWISLSHWCHNILHNDAEHNDTRQNNSVQKRHLA